MPVLVNPKHEQFARNVANEMAIGEAYVAAGYPHSPASASQLHARQEIKARIAELREERAMSMMDQAANGDGADAGMPTEFDTSATGLIKQLFVNLKKAQNDGQIGHANKAIELIALLRGYLKKSDGDILEKDKQEKEAKASAPPAQKIAIADLKDALGAINSEVTRLVKGDAQ